MTEIKLESIILQVRNPSHHEEGKLQEALPNASFREEKNLNFQIQHDYIRLNELPSVLQNRTSEFNQKRIYDAKQILGMGIYYHFSDQTILSIEDIFFHPYCNHVNPELLPVVRGVYDNSVDLEEFYWTSPSISFPLKYGDVEYVLLKILKNAQKLIVNRRLNLFFALSKDVSFDSLANTKLIKMSRILFYKKEMKESLHLNMDWLANEQDDREILGAGKLKLNLEKENTLCFKNFEWRKEENILFFHPLSLFLREFQDFLHQLQHKGKEDDFVSEINIPPYILDIPLASHETIQFVTQFLSEKQKQYPFLDYSLNFDVKQISPKDYHYNLYISKSNQLSFALVYDKHHIFNFGFLVHHITSGFEQGFRYLFEEDNFSDRRGAKRSRDLKFVKHTGFYSLYIYHILKYILEDDPKEPEKFLDELFITLGKALNLSEGIRAEDNLKFLVSKNIINILSLNFFRIYEDFKEGTLSVFTKKSEYKFQDAKKRWAELLLCILDDLLVQSEGELFQKSRGVYFPFVTNLENEKSWEISTLKELESLSINERVAKYSMYSKTLKKHIRVQSLFDLKANGWKLFIDGKELETLDANDFSWRFQVINESQEGIEKQKMDWFSLHPKFFLHGEEVDVNAAIDFSQGGWLEHAGKVYVLKDKDLPQIKALEKFWAKMTALSEKSSSSSTKSNVYELPKSSTLELLALRSMGIDVQGEKDWQEICAFYDSLSEKREPVVSPHINGELKPYQQSGLRWLQDLYQLRLGGILADDMGLGKTLQTLAFLECLRQQGKLANILIVVPTSLVYNWKSEAEKFTPKLPMYSFNAKEKDGFAKKLQEDSGCILITTYGLLTEHSDFFADFAWNVHIYDEAQNIKNIVTKRATAARNVEAKFKVCLTGTPLENHLGEFYSLMDTVVPGSLGDYSEYKKTYINPLVIKKYDMDYLKAKIRPLVLRRTKKEILKELPEKTVSVMRIPFTEEQKKVYRDVALSWNKKVKDSVDEVGQAKSQMIMLTALLRLRQVCSDPSSIPGVNYTEEPPKISLLRDTVLSIVESGESAIIFTQFITSLEKILATFKKSNIPVYSIDGRMSKQKREEELTAFNNLEEGAALCMTLKTGGVGLNLTKASYVFHMEPWWNPAVENQATDRVHRIGQERHVQVYRYLMEESVEEKIEFLKKKKSEHFDALFQNIESEVDIQKTSSSLSKEDFEFLLS